MMYGDNQASKECLSMRSRKTSSSELPEKFFAENKDQIVRYSRRVKMYDVETQLMNWVLGKKRRRKLFEEATGRLLEVGVGTGANIAFYPSSNLEMIAIDVTPAMLTIAQKRVDRMQVPIDLLVMDVMQLDFPDNYFDRIVGSCVFCSISDPIRGFCELGRVLKPSGEIRLLEHMRPDFPFMAWLFDRMDPMMYRIAGFHVARQTLMNIQNAGLKIKSDQRGVWGIFHYLEIT